LTWKEAANLVVDGSVHGLPSDVDPAPKDIVAVGYNLIANRHLAWINKIRGDPRLQFPHAVPKTAKPIGPRISNQSRPRGVR